MRILICDDHAIFRAGLRTVLDALSGDISLEESPGAEEALAVVAEGGIDLVLLDLEMPGMHGSRALRRFRRRHPNVAVVIVSASEDPREVKAALDDGAAGFIPKSSSAELLRAALEVVLSGGVYIPRQLLQSEDGAVADTSPAPRERRKVDLTSRQREVLVLMSRGLSNREIGEILGIAAGTVKAHAAALFEILEVSNRTEATLVMSELDLDDA